MALLALAATLARTGTTAIAGSVLLEGGDGGRVTKPVGQRLETLRPLGAFDFGLVKLGNKGLEPLHDVGGAGTCSTVSCASSQRLASM
jgi:hypothetical protein